MAYYHIYAGQPRERFQWVSNIVSITYIIVKIIKSHQMHVTDSQLRRDTRLRRPAPIFRTPRTMLPRFPELRDVAPSSSSLRCDSAMRNSISPLNDHPDVVDLRGRVNSKLGRPCGVDDNECPLSPGVTGLGAELGVVGVLGREMFTPLLRMWRWGRIAV